MTDMTPFAVALCCVTAYLLGSIPFGYLAGKINGVDIRTVGSGNVGATNVFRCVGKGWGIAVFACDFLKGFAAARLLPPLAVRLGDAPSTAGLAIACAFLAVAGHNWPITLRFKGGKGVATTAGALVGIAPFAVLVGVLTWIVVFASTRYVSLGSIAAAVAVPLSAWLMAGTSDTLLPVSLTFLGLLVIWRHSSNLRRLLNGTENRFSFGRNKDRAESDTGKEHSPE